MELGYPGQGQAEQAVSDVNLQAPPPFKRSFIFDSFRQFTVAGVWVELKSRFQPESPRFFPIFLRNGEIIVICILVVVEFRLMFTKHE